ncbi:hypothetical protein F8388_008041 [Cannabis sativa]|nr:hypothetical protein F8388_008041 [Cannabis sativa]
MAKISLLISLLLCNIFLLVAQQTTAQQPSFLFQFCLNDKGNYTLNSTYEANLIHLLTTLPTSQNDNGYGFYNVSYGKGSDQVYAVGLCRGDATPDICRSCLNDSMHVLTDICPNQKEACTPDLPQQQCINCLDYVYSRIPNCCSGRVGGRVVGPTCSVRYEKYLFYGSPYDPRPPSQKAPAPSNNTINNATEGQKSSHKSRNIIIAVVATVAGVIKEVKEKCTSGYMAPEYAMHGHFSPKSDVFSFEIVSGQKNNSFRQGEYIEDLLSYTWRIYREGNTSKMVDPLMRVGSASEVMRCIHIGLLCVQENIENRPTMNAIVLMLNSNSLSLPLPSEPAFFMRSNTGSHMSFGSDFNSRETTKSSNHSKNECINEASITELFPR